MPNVKLSYLYRDGANYKNYGEVVFSNPDNLAVEELNDLFRTKLIDGTWFYVDKWNVPDLHFIKWDNQIDNIFHEYESLEITDETPTDTRTITRLLESL